ncbi:hypothetical protein P280DRAFT_480057 [Massarina eburnea CBS 473.64]|uniref:F-box domain-containing protein n=1 Tax=Massarina eburnea CBS 473.64 TaxID=1395130 RepID=A0A6A6S0D6_9PLEO|nr:hypothetical protein P280DRAFT_480057 [Massarina eburnea CBS 473.64]
MSQQPAGRIVSLPPEMWENVFKHVRSGRNRKSICLVSRTWRAFMMPIMWEKFCTNLQETETRKIVNLVNPNNGNLPYVRHLSIFLSKRVILEEWADMCAVLRLLVTTIPNNRLQTFVTNIDVSSQDLILILQTHQTLEKLSVPLVVKDTSEAASEAVSDEISPANATWLVPAFANLKDLTAHTAASNVEQSIKPYNFIIRNAPKLERLVIDRLLKDKTRRGYPNLSKLLPWGPSMPMPTTITKLRFVDMNLGRESRALAQILRFEILETLAINKCLSVVPFLTAVASQLSRIQPALKKLYIILLYSLPEGPDTLRAIENVLLSFPSLDTLVVDHDPNHLISKESVMNHPDLKVLALPSTHAKDLHHHSIVDLRDMFQTCTKIEVLHLNLNLGRVSDACIDLCETFRVGRFEGEGPDTEIELLLGAIGTLPNLCVLRMTDLPNINYMSTWYSDPDNPFMICIPPRVIPIARACMKNIATEIMRYLAACGSPIKLFTMNPYRVFLRPKPDLDGHTWPTYYYLRGRAFDGLGSEYVIVTPVPNINEEILRHGYL